MYSRELCSLNLENENGTWSSLNIKLYADKHLVMFLQYNVFTFLCDFIMNSESKVGD